MYQMISNKNKKYYLPLRTDKNNALKVEDIFNVRNYCMNNAPQYKTEP